MQIFLILTADSHQDSVKGRGRSSSLHVSKNSSAGVEAEPVSHELKSKPNFVLLSY